MRFYDAWCTIPGCDATTQIGYWLPEEGDVMLAIYNMAGQVARVLESDFQMRGYHQLLLPEQLKNSASSRSNMIAARSKCSVS